MKRFGFPKSERLRSRKLIKELFKESSSFFAYPLKLLVKSQELEVSPQVLFSVPKRHYKKAVVRNKIKRQLREAYRLQKNDFPQLQGHLLAVIYVAKKAEPYSLISQRMGELLGKVGGKD